VTTLGLYREEADDYEAAICWYQQGLDVDPVQERFYQRYMTCCHRLGRYAKVEKTFQCCKETLRRVLGVNPSRQTITTYQDARRA